MLALLSRAVLIFPEPDHLLLIAICPCSQPLILPIELSWALTVMPEHARI